MSNCGIHSKAYSYVGDVPVFRHGDRPIRTGTSFSNGCSQDRRDHGADPLSPVMVGTAIAIKLDSRDRCS